MIGVTEKDYSETFFGFSGRIGRRKKCSLGCRLCISLCVCQVGPEEAPSRLWSRYQGHLLQGPKGPWLWAWWVEVVGVVHVAAVLLRGPSWQVLTQDWGGLLTPACPGKAEPQCCGLLIGLCPPIAGPSPCHGLLSPNPRTVQDRSWGMGALALLSMKAMVLPPPSPSARSLLLLSTSTQKWLQQPLALGSALHL